MKRVGGYLKSILPLVAMLGIQFAASTVQVIRFMVQYGVEEGTQIYMNDTMTVLLISDVLLLGVAGLWYYISVVRRREKYGIRETSLFQKKRSGRITSDGDRKSTRLNSSHSRKSRMPSSA